MAVKRAAGPHGGACAAFPTFGEKGWELALVWSPWSVSLCRLPINRDTSQRIQWHMTLGFSAQSLFCFHHWLVSQGVGLFACLLALMAGWDSGYPSCGAAHSKVPLFVPGLWGFPEAPGRSLPRGGGGGAPLVGLSPQGCSGDPAMSLVSFCSLQFPFARRNGLQRELGQVSFRGLHGLLSLAHQD